MLKPLGAYISSLPWEIVAPTIFGTCLMGAAWMLWRQKKRGEPITFDEVCRWVGASLCLACFELGMIYGEHNQICPLEIWNGLQCSGTNSVVFF